MTFVVEISSLRGGSMPTRQSRYDFAVSKQAVLFLANNVGGLLRHVVSRDDGWGEAL